MSADIQTILLDGIAGRQPEGISLFVVGKGISDTDATLVARRMATILHPDRRFGDLLHREPVAGGWEVVIGDRGPRYATTQGHAPVPPRRSR